MSPNLLSFRDISEFFRYVIDKNTDLPDFVKGPSIYRVNEIARRMLKVSGHIPVVTNVAYAAGYCRYFARLSEAVGVRSGNKRHYGILAGRISGKGSKIHQAMGIILSKIFIYPKFIDEVVANISDYKKLEATFREIFITSSDELKNIIDISENSDERHLITKLLLSFFLNVSRSICNVFELDVSELRNFNAIIEQNLYSYEFNLRGTPDLILEYQSDKEKYAIVVDWKTYGKGVYKTDRAQVIAYSLIQSDRMYNELKEDEKIKAITGYWDDSERKIKGVSILPMVIRATGRVDGHPILKDTPTQEDFKQFEDLVYKVKVAAQHLKLLLVNQEDELIGSPRSETTFDLIFGNDQSKKYRINLIRLGPYHLPRGKPWKQDSYPCMSRNRSPICTLMKACKYYFGRGFGLNDDFDSLMWKIRFMIFKNKEEDLLVYKAIYELFKQFSYRRIINHIENGGKIEYDISNQSVSLKNPAYYTSDSSYFSFPYLSIKNNIRELFRVRIDVIDELEYSQDNELIGSRIVRKYETGIGYRILEDSRILKQLDISSSDVRLINVVNEGKTSIIAPLNKYSHNPLISPHLFTYVDTVDIVASGSSFKVQYLFRPPSRILNYAHQLFRYIIYQHKDITTSDYDKYFMFEVNVDLTSLELTIVDLLQRQLGSSLREFRGNREEMEALKELVSNTPEDESSEQEGSFLDMLRTILGRGGVVKR